MNARCTFMIVGIMSLAAGLAGGEEPMNKTSSLFHTKRRPAATADVPTVKTIKRARAEAYQSFGGQDDVESFDIDLRDVETILSFFKDSEIDPTPLSDVYELGSLRLDLGNKEVHRFCWYSYAPDERLSFSWKGVRYLSKPRRDGKNAAFQLDELIRQLHERNRPDK